MERPYHFTAEVAESGGGSVVVVPAEIAAALTSDRPLIDALINGEPYEVRLGTWRKVCYLRLRKDFLRRLGIGRGAEVQVEFGEVAEEPAALMPEPEPTDSPELAAALENRSFAAQWSALPEDHRREYRRWIAGAEQPDARTDRVARLTRRLTGPAHQG